LRRMQIPMDIKVDDLTGSEIAELLQEHLQRLAQHSLPESIRTLDIGGLRKTEITFWSVWSNSELLGYGALKELNAQHGEIKSMRTASLHQRKGVAAKRLKHILEEAKHRKYKRVSLETGSNGYLCSGSYLICSIWVQKMQAIL